MVNEQIRRVENRTRDELLCTNSYVDKVVGIPLIVTYHPHLNGLNKLMLKNLKHLQADQTIKLVSHHYLLYHFIQRETSEVI